MGVSMVTVKLFLFFNLSNFGLRIGDGKLVVFGDVQGRFVLIFVLGDDFIFALVDIFC